MVREVIEHTARAGRAVAAGNPLAVKSGCLKPETPMSVGASLFEEQGISFAEGFDQAANTNVLRWLFFLGYIRMLPLSCLDKLRQVLALRESAQQSLIAQE